MPRRRRRARVVLFSSIIADGEKAVEHGDRLPVPMRPRSRRCSASPVSSPKDVAEYGITVNALMSGLILGEQGTRIRDRLMPCWPESARMLAGYPGGQPGRRRRRRGRVPVVGRCALRLPVSLSWSTAPFGDPDGSRSAHAADEVNRLARHGCAQRHVALPRIGQELRLIGSTPARRATS